MLDSCLGGAERPGGFLALFALGGWLGTGQDSGFCGGSSALMSEVLYGREGCK